MRNNWAFLTAFFCIAIQAEQSLWELTAPQAGLRMMSAQICAEHNARKATDVEKALLPDLSREWSLIMIMPGDAKLDIFVAGKLVLIINESLLSSPELAQALLYREMVRLNNNRVVQKTTTTTFIGFGVIAALIGGLKYQLIPVNTFLERTALCASLIVWNTCMAKSIDVAYEIITDRDCIASLDSQKPADKKTLEILATYYRSRGNTYRARAFEGVLV